MPQLAITIHQTGSQLSVSGSIAQVGAATGYNLPTRGPGTVALDSTVEFTLHGLAGRQHVRARLISRDYISGSLNGDRVDGERAITLVRREFR
jgi:hypothetical protein